MGEHDRLTLQPLVAVLVKLRIELQIDSKEKRAVDYALWDLVRSYHSCDGLMARHAILLVLQALYFVPGDYYKNKSKKDILAYALVPPSETDAEDLMLLYRVTLNKGKDDKLRRVNFPTVTQNATQTTIAKPNHDLNVDLRWVLCDENEQPRN